MNIYKMLEKNANSMKIFAAKGYLKCLLALFIAFSSNFAVSAVSVQTANAPDIIINWPNIATKSRVGNYTLEISYADHATNPDHWPGQCWSDSIPDTTFSINANNFVACNPTGNYNVTVYPLDDNWNPIQNAEETVNFAIGGTDGDVINVTTSNAPEIIIDWANIATKSIVGSYTLEISYADHATNPDHWSGQCWSDSILDTTFSINANNFVACKPTGKYNVTVIPLDDNWNPIQNAKESADFTIGDGEPPVTDIPVFSLGFLKRNAPPLPPNLSLADLGSATPELPDTDIAIPSLNDVELNSCSTISTVRLPDIVEGTDGARNINPEEVFLLGPYKPGTNFNKLKPEDITDPNNIMINWRRNTNRNNPIWWMAAAADPSVEPRVRRHFWDRVNIRFRHLLAESLPMSSAPAGGSQNNESTLSGAVQNSGPDGIENTADDFFEKKQGAWGNEEGPWYEHQLVSYLIPYRELLKKANYTNPAIIEKRKNTVEAVEKAILAHANWLLSKHGGINSPDVFTIGPIDHPSLTSNFRAWMRLFKNMVLFSESPVIKSAGLDVALVKKAEQMLTWFKNEEFQGPLNLDNIDLGWNRGANGTFYYFDRDVTLNPDRSTFEKRLIWMRFLELWQGVLAQIKETDFYCSHPGIDALIGDTQLTTEKVVFTSNNYLVESSVLQSSFTNYRTEAWLLDAKNSNGCPEQQSSGEADVCHSVIAENVVNPRAFILNYNRSEFFQHMCNLATAAKDVHYYRYLPATLSAHTRLDRPRACR